MNPLEGAEFTLTRDGADLGTYSTAPGGTVTLPMPTTGTIIDVPPGASGTSFWKLTGSGGAYTLTVTNAIDYELPAVGGAGIYLSMLLGTGAMCAAAKDGIDQSVCNQTILENTIKIKKGSNL